MTIEQQVKDALTEQGRSFQPPRHIKERVMNELTAKPSRKRKKRLAASVLAAMLLIPTSAFSYQALVADEFYGSFDEMKKHFASATMEKYMLLNTKLLQAKGEIEGEDYLQFKKALQVIVDGKLQYGNEDGNIIYDDMPAAERERVKQALMRAQPFFDQLNDLPSSRDVLTEAEYEAYIEALITYENITAQHKSGAAAQADLQEARRIMDEVNEKQGEAFYKKDH